MLIKLSPRLALRGAVLAIGGYAGPLAADERNGLNCAVLGGRRAIETDVVSMQNAYGWTKMTHQQVQSSVLV